MDAPLPEGQDEDVLDGAPLLDQRPLDADGDHEGLSAPEGRTFRALVKDVLYQLDTPTPVEPIMRLTGLADSSRLELLKSMENFMGEGTDNTAPSEWIVLTVGADLFSVRLTLELEEQLNLGVAGAIIGHLDRGSLNGGRLMGKTVVPIRVSPCETAYLGWVQAKMKSQGVTSDAVFSLDDRRLAAARMAKSKVKTRWATPDEIGEFATPQTFLHTDGG